METSIRARAGPDVGDERYWNSRPDGAEPGPGAGADSCAAAGPPANSRDATNTRRAALTSRAGRAVLLPPIVEERANRRIGWIESRLAHLDGERFLARRFRLIFANGGVGVLIEPFLCGGEPCPAADLIGEVDR